MLELGLKRSGYSAMFSHVMVEMEKLIDSMEEGGWGDGTEH
ncbi:hypothetical protein AB1I68_19095 [Paenibacillus pabuli]